MPNAQGHSVFDDGRISPSISATDASYDGTGRSSNSRSPVDDSETMVAHAIGKPTLPGSIDWHSAIIVGVVVCIAVISLFLLWLSYSRRRSTLKSMDKEDQYLMEAVPTGKDAQPTSCDNEGTKLKHPKKSSTMVSVPSSGTPSSTDDIGLGRKTPRLKAVYICLPEQQFAYSKKGKQQTAVTNSTKIVEKEENKFALKVKHQELLKQQKFTKTNVMIKDRRIKLMEQVASNTPVKEDSGLKMNIKLDKTVPNIKTKLLTGQAKYKKNGVLAAATDAPDITLLTNLKIDPKIVKKTMSV